jgi:hypothetical protein
LLNGKQSFTSFYTDDEGQRAKFFEIVKKFEGDVKDEPGNAIDVHMGWVSQEGKYITEYLVTPKLLIKTMEKETKTIYLHMQDDGTFNTLLFNFTIIPNVGDYVSYINESDITHERWFGKLQDKKGSSLRSAYEVANNWQVGVKR